MKTPAEMSDEDLIAEAEKWRDLWCDEDERKSGNSHWGVDKAGDLLVELASRLEAALVREREAIEHIKSNRNSLDFLERLAAREKKP